jgi:imidazolonepropionase-like amidohydrolase
MRILLTVLVSLAVGVASPLLDAQSAVVALTGATLIDGNGGPPVADAVVIVSGGRIRSAGSRAATTVPADASVIDASGKFIVPGLIDTNVHLSLYGGVQERYETLAKYHSRQKEIVLEAAQIELKHGVTTVRDSYGLLLPLVAARDDIAAGRSVGARILAAGNIIGWGGPYSVSFSLIKELGLTLFQEQVNDDVSQGVGEELVDLSPEELRVTIRAYLDKGADFLKYGGTAHFARPAFIGFSPEAQKVIVDEAHARGKVAETHATTIDGLGLSIAAGIDLIQHPELFGTRELTLPLVKDIVEKKIVCSMLVSTITGEAWARHLKDAESAAKKRAEAETNDAGVPARPKTAAELRQRQAEDGLELEMRRRNAQTLIKAGAVITPGTDSYWAAAPEFSRTPKPRNQDHGIGTVLAIEGLVELGMTPAQALVAGTRNGAIASRGVAEFGTLESGKRADLLVLDASPLDDIKNLRKISMVMKDGAVVNRESLPAVRVLSRPGQ